MIKREFLDGRIVVYNADCLEVMKEIGDKEIDLVLTDPPYGGGSNESDWDNKKRGRFGGWFDKYHIQVERTGGGYAKKYGKDIKHWDFAPDAACFDEIFRISKEQIIWGGNYFELPATRCFLIWDKQNAGRDFADCEQAWTSFDKVARIFVSRVANDFLHRIHPTQKPVKLYQWLLHNYAKPGQTIFDSHLGSASSAIAAHYFGCTFIGVELDEDYFTASVERFKLSTAQTDLMDFA